MLYAIVIDPVYRDIQNVAHRVQVVKGVDGLNRGPTAMALRSYAGRSTAEQSTAWLSVDKRGMAMRSEVMRRIALGRSSTVGFR